MKKIPAHLRLMALIIAWCLFILGIVWILICLASTPTHSACTPLPPCGTEFRGTPTLVQSATVDAGTSSTATLSLSGDGTVTGDIFVAIRAGSHTGHSFRVTDSTGSSYIKVRQLELSNDTVSLALFVAENVGLGPNTITVTDDTAAGTLRVIAQKYMGVGAYVPSSAASLEGSSSSVVLPPPPATGVRYVALSASNGTTATVPAGTPGDSVAGKLFAYGNPMSVTLNPADAWATITADFEAGTECASPTPVLMHDPAVETDIAAVTTFYRMPGGTWQKLVDDPCWNDIDGVTRICRGVQVGDVLQRDCPSCQPHELYEFSRKWLDNHGNYSVDFSNVVSVCFSPVCTPPGPCD